MARARLTLPLVAALVAAPLSSPARAEDPAPPAAAPAAAEAEAPKAAGPAIPFEKYTLDNGLEVILHQDKRQPFIAVSVWYHVGAFEEEQGKTGFAHLFEHLMFQGTPHVPGDAHFKFLEEAGAAVINGSTSFDRTNYFEVVPRHELELALWLESSRMGWLMKGVDQAKLDEQRGVVKNERRQTTESQPYGLAEEALWQRMFPASHPYYGGVIGSLADLDRASLDDVGRFYDTYYAPSNATLALAGDFDPAQVKQVVEKYFKTLPGAPRPTKRQVPPPTITSPIRLDFNETVGAVPRVMVQYFTPAVYAPGDADFDVLAFVLGGGPSSRLHQALVVDAPLVEEVSAYQQSMANVSVFTIAATVRPGVPPQDVLDAIQSQLALLNDLPPSAEEVARAVNTIEADKTFNIEMLFTRAEQLQGYNHSTGDPGYLEKDIARYRAVTPDSLLAAVKAHLAPEKRAVLVAAPAGSGAPAPAAAAAPATPAPESK